MTLKDFAQEGFSKGEITAIVSLDVERAFNSAWAQIVLKNLQESECPRNLYNLTKIISAKEHQTWKQTTSNWREQ